MQSSYESVWETLPCFAKDVPKPHTDTELLYSPEPALIRWWSHHPRSANGNLWTATVLHRHTWLPLKCSMRQDARPHWGAAPNNCSKRSACCKLVTLERALASTRCYFYGNDIHISALTALGDRKAQQVLNVTWPFAALHQKPKIYTIYEE